MSVFKTPLFNVLVVFVAVLILFSWQGFFKRTIPPVPPPLDEPGYHLAQGRIENREGKGWSFQGLRVDGTPLEFKSLLLPAAGLLEEREIVPGDHVIFWARAGNPSPVLWEGVFNFRQYLAQEGLLGVLYLDRPADIKVISSHSSPRVWLDRLHERFLKLLRREFPDPHTAGLLGGILLGDKRLLESSLKQSFVRAGVMHLMVASGLHVTLAFSFFFALVLWVLRLGRGKALAAALAATWAFSVFIGLSPPVLRAAAMVTVLSLASGFRRETPALCRLFLAAALFLAAQPRLIEDASFLLSFVSTFGILYGWLIFEEPASKRWWKTIAVCAATSFFAWASLLPFSAAFFHEISLVSPVSNLILVPFSSLLLGLGAAHFTCLAWVPYLGDLSRAALSGACGLFIKTTDFLAGIPYASVASASWNAMAACAWLSAMAAAGIIRSRGTWRGLGGGVLAGSGFILGLFFMQTAFAAPRLELLQDHEGPVGIYVRRGWRGVLCLSRELEGTFQQASLDQFLKSRGHGRWEDACSAAGGRNLGRPLGVMETLAFDRGRRRLKVSCGTRVLIFPFTVFNPDPSSSAIELGCRQGFL